MQIEPPGGVEWAALLIVGALAGMVNALRSYARRGQKERLLVGAVEGATALFVTITSFLVLHSILPQVFGLSLHPLGDEGCRNRNDGALIVLLACLLLVAASFAALWLLVEATV